MGLPRRVSRSLQHTVRTSGPETLWEQGPLETLAARGDLVAYRHEGFWQPMDTLRDKHQLEDLWQSGKAPWKCW